MLKATPESPRMFESDFIDLFSRTHASIVPILYVPATLILLWYSIAQASAGVWATAGLFVLGFFSWSLTEYWLHRTFFHWEPRAKWGARMHFLVHGVHHTWPRDRFRLVMPPAVSVTLFVVFITFFYFSVGNVYCWALHAGYTAGYMFYDMVHYWTHHGRATSPYAKALKRHHMLHHFRDKEARYGVSFAFWDYVFGTMPKSDPHGKLDEQEEAAEPAE
jgi:sterol desaturase/sphingolipid hydroxylase (fatty acid hydroxylase superfamily)